MMENILAWIGAIALYLSICYLLWKLIQYVINDFNQPIEEYVSVLLFWWIWIPGLILQILIYGVKYSRDVDKLENIIKLLRIKLSRR